MSAIDQLVRELQERQPRWGHVDEAHPAQAVKRKSVNRQSVATASHQEWIHTILLSGVVVAGLMAVQLWRTDSPQSFAGVSPKVSVAQPRPALPQRPIVHWQMDWRLSLDKLRTPSLLATTVDATQDARLPSQAVHQDVVVANQAVDEPDRLASALMQGQGPLMIDPPAAGRAQSVEHQVQVQYRKAMDLLEQGREIAALDLLSQVLILEPRHIAARRLAITLALDHQQSEKAQVWLDEGVKLHPDDGDLRTFQARVLSQVGTADEAVTVLQDIQNPSAEALGLKAGLLVKLGRHAQAVTAYEQALKTHPDNATWWLGLGVSCQAQGQANAAKDAFAKAWQLGRQGQLSPDVQAWLEQQL